MHGLFRLFFAVTLFVFVGCSPQEPRNAEFSGEGLRASFDESEASDVFGRSEPGDGHALSDVSSGDRRDPERTQNEVVDDPVGGGDARFIHVESHAALASASAPFTSVVPTFVDDPLTLPHLDVRVMRSSDEGLWIGTSEGLYLRGAADESYVLQPYPTAGFIGVRDISQGVDDIGRRVVLFDGWLQWVAWDEEMPEALPIEDETLSVLAVHEDVIWLGGDSGLRRFNGELDAPVDVIDGDVRDLAFTSDGALWIATSEGVYRLYEGAFTMVMPGNAHALLAHADGVWSGDVEGVTWLSPLDDPIRLSAGVGAHDCGAEGPGATCTPCVDCEGTWLSEGCDVCGDGRCAKSETGSHCPQDCGLPSGDVHTLAYRDGRLAIGHDRGATMVHLSQEVSPTGASHFSGAYWLPGQQVTSVAFFGDTFVVGTEDGLTLLDETERRLSVDAEVLEERMDAHFWRMGGFLAPEARLDQPRDPQEHTLGDSELDGFATQMQVAAWCYAYALSGDEEVYKKARKALEALFLLVDIPGKAFQSAGKARGFVARSLVRDDEVLRFSAKALDPAWHRVSWTDDHDYYWLGDTSSADLAAHIFGYALFFDLCAQDELERLEIAQRVSLITHTLITSNYQLVGLDGLATGEGPWPPERVAAAVDGPASCDARAAWCEDSWSGAAWLKGVQTLGQLLASFHMTGDVAFYEAYEALIVEHRFDEMLTPRPQHVSLTCPTEMDPMLPLNAVIAYHTLIRYEANSERRSLWMEGFRTLMQWAHVKRDPLWAALASLSLGEGSVDMHAALASLREMPLSAQNWAFDNHHRRDALEWPRDSAGDAQFDRVFPYSERGPVTWRGNRHTKVGSGDGLTLVSPGYWLFAYHALRYAGVLSE